MTYIRSVVFEALVEWKFSSIMQVGAMRPDTTPPIDPPQERHREEDQDESAASATRSMGDRPQGKPNRLAREVRAVRKGILQEEGFQKEMGQRRKDQIEIPRQRAE